MNAFPCDYERDGYLRLSGNMIVEIGDVYYSKICRSWLEAECSIGELFNSTVN